MADLDALVADPAAQAAAVAGESVVPGWPPHPDERLLAIVADLDKLDDLRVFHAEFDHYGCGYSSSVEVKLTRSDDLGAERFGGLEVEGFGVLLNRLAPITALQATASRLSRENGMSGAGSLPCLDELTGLPVPGYPEAEQVVGVLRRHGYSIVDPSVLRAPIAPGLEPESNFGEPPWSAFDAWFYWYD